MTTTNRQGVLRPATTDRILTRADVPQDAGFTPTAMTLRELRDRLTALIEEHEARGWQERNDYAVTVRLVQPATPTGKSRRAVYVPVNWVGSASQGLTVDPTDMHHATQWVIALNGDTMEAR